MALGFGPRYLGGEKTISSVLSQSIVRPLTCSQFSTSSSFVLAESMALYGVADTARIAPSSTYNDREAWVHEALSVSRYDVNMALNMGDRGEPWGVPSGTEKGSVVEASNRMEAFLLVKKEKTQFTIFGGNPFFAKISLTWLASI